VDVARPGRQPLREDVAPNLQAGAAGDAGAGETPSDTPAVTSPATPPSSSGQKNDSSPPSRTPNANLKEKCNKLKESFIELEKYKGAPNIFGISKQNPLQAQNRFAIYRTEYGKAQANKIASINVGTFTPAGIANNINKQWDINSRGQTRPGRLQTRYPFQLANDQLSSGISYLLGSLKSQIESPTCVNALK
jgi:hypothetical protein